MINGLLGNLLYILTMENQMDKKMGNEMDIGICSEALNP